MFSVFADLVSKHPSCRESLRYHWPCPHYHRPLTDNSEGNGQHGDVGLTATSAAIYDEVPPPFPVLFERSGAHVPPAEAICATLDTQCSGRVGVARATVTSSQCPFHHPRRAGRRPPNVTVRYGRQLRQCVTRGEPSLQGTLLQSSHYDASRLGESVRTVSRLSVPEARTGEAHPPYNLCGALASFTYNAASHSMCNVVQSLEQTTTTATMGITVSESPSLSAAGSPFRSGHDHVMGGSVSAAQGLLWNELSADVEDGQGNHHRHTLLAPPGQRIHLADTLPLTHYPDAPSLLATTTTMASSSSIVIADATSSGMSRSVGCAGRSTTTTLNRSQRPAPLLKVVLANKRNAQGGQILGNQSPASTLAVMNSHTAGREPWLNGLAPPHGANHWGASFAVPEGPVGLHNSLRYHSPTVLRTSLHSSANGEEDNSLLKLFRSHISSYPVPTASPQCGSDASLIERGSGSLPTLRVERPSSPFLAPRCLPHQKKKWKAFCCYQRPQSARPPLLRQASSTLATSKKPSHSMSQDTLFMSPNSDDFGAGEYAMEWQPSRVWSAGTHSRAYCHTWDSETDEDAMLEALTITTSSSCAFGVGLEGLDWRVLMEAEDNDAATVASSSRATGRSAGERCIGQSELDETAPVSTRGHLLEDEIHPRTILTHTLPDQTPSRLGAQTASPYMAAGSTGGHRVGPNVTSSAADLCTHYGTAVPTGSRGVPAFRLERSEAYQTEATLYARKQQKQMANQRALANLVRSNRYTSTRPMQPPRPEVMNSPPSADLHLGDPTDVLVRSGSQTGAELRRPTNALSRGHADAGRDSHKCTVTESSPERRAAAGSPDHVLGALTPGVMRDNAPYVSALRSVEIGSTCADNQIGNIGAHAYEGLAPVLSLAGTAQPGLPSVVSQPPRLKSEHSVHMGGEIRQWLQNVMEASQSLNCDEGCQY